ncbi:putative retrotransposon hot spot protein 4 (RHS4) [Trypanosoma vivax]|nr:putative retrotransposon hot spot protein 4 (RHS4) [Trypanosoma vivax]
MERLCHPNSTVREVKDRWTELSERINVVGPLLRYVLFAHNYVEREREVEAALLELDNDMMDLYERVLIEKVAWRESKSSHKLVKLFRVHRDGCGENYRNTGVSVKVSQTLMRMVLQRKHSAEGRERVLRAVVLNYGRDSARLFETYTIYTFLQKELFEPVAHNLVKLYRRQRKEPPECDSVIRRRDSAVLYPKEIALIQKGDNRKLKCGVMYVPLNTSFPVIDGFFVVEGEPWTVVALQATFAKQHHTTASKVVLLKEELAQCFCEWNIFTDELRWEIIYMQPAGGNAIKTMQLCSADATGKAALTFWKSVQQYRVSLEPESDAVMQEAARVTGLVQAFGEVNVEEEVKTTKRRVDGRRSDATFVSPPIA